MNLNKGEILFCKLSDQENNYMMCEYYLENLPVLIQKTVYLDNKEFELFNVFHLNLLTNSSIEESNG